MMLNFFANAAPSIIPVSEDKVDVNFIVEEKPAGQANANMGYTQSIGMTGGGGLALPNFRAWIFRNVSECENWHQPMFYKSNTV